MLSEKLRTQSLAMKKMEQELEKLRTFAGKENVCEQKANQETPSSALAAVPQGSIASRLRRRRR